MSDNQQANKKICAWITRHHPTRRQSTDLRSAGYTIVYIPIRGSHAREILSLIRQRLYNKEPDLIVAAHPISTLHHLAQQAPCPVLIAEMDHSYQVPKWTGEWKRVIRNQLITRPFSHEEM